jgi:hypothetical protein
MYHGRFILVASPDARHWGGSEYKKQRKSIFGSFRFFPLWSLTELLAARPYIRNDFSDDDVHQRYYLFGGVPRNVFIAKERVNSILASQVEASNTLTPQQLTKIAKTGYNAVSTFSELQPRSAILGYGRSGLDYIDYTKINVVPISEKVIETIFVNHQAFLWNEFSRYSDSSVVVCSFRRFVPLYCMGHHIRHCKRNH